MRKKGKCMLYDILRIIHRGLYLPLGHPCIYQRQNCRSIAVKKKKKKNTKASVVCPHYTISKET